jgi:hypothetical protein
MSKQPKRLYSGCSHHNTTPYHTKMASLGNSHQTPACTKNGNRDNTSKIGMALGRRPCQRQLIQQTLQSIMAKLF